MSGVGVGAGSASASTEGSPESVVQPIRGGSSGSDDSMPLGNGEALQMIAVAAASQGAQSKAAAAELEVIRLLHRAAQTPEELLYHAVELGRLGVISHDTLEKLCSSLGLPPLSGATFGSPQPAVKAWPERLQQPRPIKQTGLHPNRSRLANEFVLLRKLGQARMCEKRLATYMRKKRRAASVIVPVVRAAGRSSSARCCAAALRAPACPPLPPAQVARRTSSKCASLPNPINPRIDPFQS